MGGRGRGGERDVRKREGEGVGGGGGERCKKKRRGGGGEGGGREKEIPLGKIIRIIFHNFGHF